MSRTGVRMSTDGGQHNFAMVPSANIQRSVFNRSHGVKTTFNAGLLIPIFVDDVLPGDTMQLSATAFGRLPTLLRPIMDNVYLDFFFFFVPYRLVWTNFKKFNGEQVNPGDSTSFLIPQVPSTAGTGWAELSLADYFGVPTKITNLNVNALPFRAYNLIWNEWFRDENLQNSVTVPLTDGPDAAATYVVLPRGKRHDYFTSALPWAQKGTPVSLPLGITAPVKAGTEHLTTGTNPALLMRRVDTNAVPAANNILGFSTGGQVQTGTGTLTGVATVYPSNLFADLALATAATINQLREAFQVQRLLERDARGGTRYTEIVRSHFGVISPDSRLQRPEYLGGGSIPVNINPVAATNENLSPGTFLGDLGANGTFGTQHVGFRQSFTEHGVVIGLVEMRADLNYQSGAERFWLKRTRYDLFWPALANLGEQGILNGEIYAQGTAADSSIFGYQERYAEYRYKPSLVTGRMRSNSTTPLDSWHLAQKFTALPVLNAAFIVDSPPIDRVVAVSGGVEPHAVADFFFSYKCARPMPVYGVPGLIDHF